MDASKNAGSVPPAAVRLLQAAFRFSASLKLAVILLVVLAGVLAWATSLEAKHGRAYAMWFVYASPWFIGLLGLLGWNIFCAAAIRFPWKRHQTGFVVTHGGLLVLLAGSIQSFVSGIDGKVSLAEGETVGHLVMADQGQITATWLGRPEEAPYEFTFEAGPVNWPKSKTMHLGEVDGVSARLLGYYRHARSVEEWIADDLKLGGPVVRFKVTGQDGAVVAEHWLVDQQYGDALFVGPIRLQLERAVTDRMLEDFLQPSTEDPGEKGLLLMYLEGARQCVRIDDSLGKKIPLTENVSVEIAEYLPHAQPNNLGKFTSKSDEPKNPMLELRVHVAGEAEPIRQIAFAKDPLLNLDGVYPRDCPVKFRYRHPVLKPQTGVELLQTADGKLYGRTCTGGEYTSQGEVAFPASLSLPGNFQVALDEYLPYARQKVTFHPASDVFAAKMKDRSEPAALIEITSGGAKQQVWLQRNTRQYGHQIVSLGDSLMAVSYGYGRVPLGFSLELVDFQRTTNPGNVGNATYTSQVRLIDAERQIDRQQEVSMNQPLTHGLFTFYQSGFDDGGHGKETSSFSVAYDPGRFLKYAGSLLVCLGIGIMFYMKAYFFKPARRLPPREAEAGDELPATPPSAIPAPHWNRDRVGSAQSAAAPNDL